MATGTAFGPQSANVATALPAGSATNRGGTNVDTWVRDASSNTACDGTVLDAAFFNNIIGNLRYAVRQSGVTLNDGDMTLLYKAIIAAKTSFTAGAGTTVTTDANGVTTVSLALGGGTATFFTS